jgi:antitoxin component YwqK of YwqJK toxin-antitoxin module
MSKKIKTVKIFRKELNDFESNDKRGYLQNFTENDINGNVIREISYLPDGEIEEKYVNIYDEKGNLIEEINYFSEDEIAERKTYERDQNGRVTEAFIHYQDGTKDRIVHEYDQNGNLTRRATIDEDGETESEEIFEFSNGKLTAKEIREFGEVVHREEFELNEAGKVALQTITEGEDDGTTVNSFDENGNLVKHLRYNENDKLVVKAVYTFDEKGNLTGIVEETPYEKNISALEYDNNGNLISQIQTNKFDETNHTIKRKYNEQNDIIESTVFINMHGQDVDSEYTLFYEYEYFE